MPTPTHIEFGTRKCPRCTARTLHPVVAGRNTNLFCATCTACWHPEKGELRRVNPHRCAQCPDQLCQVALHGSAPGETDGFVG